MNNVNIIGNITATPELYETAGGVSVTSFNIAVRRDYANESSEYETDFFKVVAWKTLAETCCRYLEKGKKVAVTGTLRTRKYVDKNEVERTSTEIHATNIQFLYNAPPQPEGEVQQGQPEKNPRTQVKKISKNEIKSKPTANKKGLPF